MQKRGLMFAFTSIFLVAMINFVSAQFYGGFSLSDILSSIDSSTMILGVMFIVVFAFLKYSLSRVFRDNAAIAGVIAFAISLGVIWGVNRTGLDFEGFFYTLGVSEGFLFIILPLILIGGAAYLGIKYSFGALLTVIGGFFMILSFTDFIYETATTFIIGLIFLGIGFWLLMRRRGIYLGDHISSARDYVDPRQRLSRVQYGRDLDRERALARNELRREREVKRRYKKTHGRSAWLRRKSGI